VDLDYGVEFRNFDWPGDWKRPHRGRNVLLFKPHGSLNWLFCPTVHTADTTFHGITGIPHIAASGNS
jgi:hypothetical protein